MAPPLRRSTTFLQHPGTYAATDVGDWTTPLVYTRYKNPNIEDAEQRIAVLEGADAGVLFASGMAAIHALFLHVLPGGRGKVALARQIYGGTSTLLATALADLGVETIHFDVESEEELTVALEAGVQLVHIEGISNPTAIVADLPRIARQAHGAGALVSVDSTFATPVLQRPLEQGADLVVHSATKALTGHSDVTAGVVLGAADAMEKVAAFRRVTGAILDPAAAWLICRSLATLDLRVRAQCRSALALAEALDQQDAVARVHYPGLAGSPSHERAKALLAPGLFGSVLGFELAAGDGATRGYMDRLELAIDAPSLGGVETLVCIPSVMSHARLTPDELIAAGIGPGSIRVAVGIEDPADLVADFVAALTPGAG